MKFVPEEYPTHNFKIIHSSTDIFQCVKCEVCGLEIDYNGNENYEKYFCYAYINNKKQIGKILTCNEYLIKTLLE